MLESWSEEGGQKESQEEGPGGIMLWMAALLRMKVGMSGRDCCFKCGDGEKKPPV